MSFIKPFFCIFLLFHITSILKANTTPSNKAFNPYRIFITNRDVPKVVVGCDDLGANTLTPGNSMTWRFRMNFESSNAYGCRFYWLDDTTLGLRSYSTFTVFDESFTMPDLCGHNALLFTVRCYWLVTQDGFYFSNNNASFPSNQWQMMYGWTKV
ncbi:putative plant self-incompatibility S1 [Helianthus anomalus]